MDVNHIQNKIREVRKSRSMSLDKLARATELSVNHLNRMESGKHFNPNLLTLKKIADALMVPINSLIDDEKEVA